MSRRTYPDSFAVAQPTDEPESPAAEPQGAPEFPDEPLPPSALSNTDLRYMLRLAEDFLAPYGYRARAMRVDGARMVLLSSPREKILVERVSALRAIILATYS